MEIAESLTLFGLGGSIPGYLQKKTHEFHGYPYLNEKDIIPDVN